MLVMLLADPAALASDTPPIVVPLIKLEYPGNPPNIRMLYVNIHALGDQKVDQPVLFDTGSAGLTIACEVVLPAKMCSEDGIRITKDTEINGIVVTTKRVVAFYGSYEEHGNVARAKVTIGTSQNSVTTSSAIRLLIRYKKVRISDRRIVGGPLWPKGMFGASPIGGIGPDQSIQSPLNSVEVGDGLHQGYVVRPVGRSWSICTNEEGNCPVVPALQIGIAPNDRDLFYFSKIGRANPRHNFPTIAACLEFRNFSSCKPTLFDTGNSTIAIAGRVPTGLTEALPVGVDVSIDAKKAGTWKFRTEYTPEVEFRRRLDHHLVGIRFFETNSLAVDLETKELGIHLSDLSVAKPGLTIESHSSTSDVEVCRHAINISKYDWDMGYNSREWLAEADKRNLKVSQCLSLIGNPIEALSDAVICKRALNWSWRDWDLSEPRRAWTAEAAKRHLSIADCRTSLGGG
jgi:hypothetical protein